MQLHSMSEESPSTQPEPADTVRVADEHAGDAVAAKDLNAAATKAIAASSKQDALLDLARSTWVEHAASGREVTLADVRKEADAIGLGEADASTELGPSILHRVMRANASTHADPR